MLNILGNVNHSVEKATPEACKCTARKSLQHVLDRKNSTQENSIRIRRECVTLGLYRHFQDKSISKEKSVLLSITHKDSIISFRFFYEGQLSLENFTTEYLSHSST
jgi:hypothetical protein